MTDNFPQQTNQGKTVNVVGNTTINLGAFSQNQAIQFVDLPSLDTIVYGREVEAKMLADFFLAQHKHCAIVAPSCFGKTFLLRKFLQHVNANDADFKASFDKIIYFNCRELTTLSSVIDKFATCLGGKFEAENLFAHIQNERILCIFDNFESWLAQDEINSFVHKIFNTRHQLRTIFVTQEMPQDENFKAEELTVIGKKLFQGLDHEAALEFVRAEGQKAKLDQVAPDKLLRFFAEVSFIPQAIRSLIKFVEIKRIGFDEFVKNYNAGFAAFEQAQERFKDVNDEFRPTLYLLTLQIEAQDERSKDLLSVLAFFASEVPELVVEKFKPHVSAIEKEVIHSLVDNWLVEEITVFRGKDFKYYSPHAMIRQVVRASLPKFEDKHAQILESLAEELFDAAYFKHEYNHEEAINLYRCVEKLREHLVNVEGRHELANNLAGAYLNKGNALKNLGKPNEALAEYDKAMEIWKPLVENGRYELANVLAGAYMNKGVALKNLGKPNEALAEYDKAIEIRRPLVASGRHELANDLAKAYMNKGVALWNLGKLNEALAEYDKTIEILKPLVANGRHKLANDLAMAYINKGSALVDQEKYSEAEAEYNKSIEIQESLVKEEKRIELTNDLAMSYWGKGLALKNLGKINEAIKIYGDALTLWEETLLRGEIQNLPNMAIVLGIRFDTHKQAGNDDLAAKDMQRLHQLLELTRQDTRIEHLGKSIQDEIDKRS